MHAHPNKPGVGPAAAISISVRTAAAVGQADNLRSSAERFASSTATDSLIRSEGRPADVVAFEEKVVSFFVGAADVLGVPKSVAAIYGVCFGSAQPLSFADINARLDISQGSISQGLRVLRDVGAIKVVGSYYRREYFAPDLELRKLATHFIEERLEKQLKAGRGKLQEIKAALPVDNNGSAKEIRARMKYLQSWHDKGKALVPLVKTFLKLS